MSELKREWDIIKRQCERDPGDRASWIGILILLIITIVSGLLMLPVILM